MLIQVNDICKSTLLTGISGVIHGYSSRASGDARDRKHAQSILRSLTLRDIPLISAEQIHGDVVTFVRDGSVPVISGADGLVSRGSRVFLNVRVADCVPILLVDPEAEVISAVHAGWKGTLSHIARNAIECMAENGAKPARIQVSIGPHIGMCCYTVPFNRAKQFTSVFGNDPDIVRREEGGWHLNLGYINRIELLKAGVKASHIDDRPNFCTSCQSERFFSYRKDSKASFGEMIGVIGLSS